MKSRHDIVLLVGSDCNEAYEEELAELVSFVAKELKTRFGEITREKIKDSSISTRDFFISLGATIGGNLIATGFIYTYGEKYRRRTGKELPFEELLSMLRRRMLELSIDVDTYLREKYYQPIKSEGGLDSV